MGKEAGISVVVLTAFASVCVGYKPEIGWNDFVARAGDGAPTGSGIGVTQVEATQTNNYLPDPTSGGNEFIDPDKLFTDESRISPGFSNHATVVGRYYYGNVTSIAPGVLDVHNFEADDWLGDGFLRTATALPPALEAQHCQNHSWIGSTGKIVLDVEILRRIDLVVERDGVVVAAGVNNGSATPIPKLMSSAYNVLAVGLASGNSSRGPTAIESSGRIKPDIVVPIGASVDYTSFATPVVAASGGLLIESIDTHAGHIGLGRMEKSLLVKALLMGGATKTPFDALAEPWRKGFATPASDGTVPLDYRFGAGALNFDNSHRILEAGLQSARPQGALPATGWDVTRALPGGSRCYFFDIPEGTTAETLSVLATWYRRVDASVAPDLDGDRDVDPDDFDLFEACSTGADQGPPPAGCDGADLDGDGDVDQSDFGAYQRCVSGPGMPADVACYDGPAPPKLIPSLANIDLRLHEAAASVIGAEIDRSVSAIDNVEHLYLEDLPAGRYAIEVASDEVWVYALTWDARLVPAAP